MTKRLSIILAVLFFMFSVYNVSADLGDNFTSFGSGGSGEGQFGYTDSIFVDTINNRIYVADTGGNYRIDVMDSGSGGTTLGNNFTSFGSDAFSGVFVDSINNKLYATDFLNDRIDVMDSGSGGTTLGNNFVSFGSYGSDSGKFDAPSGIFIDKVNNKLYVSDRGNHRIDMMDSGLGGTTLGNNFSSFGTSGSGSGQFNFLSGRPFVDPVNNKLYVADSSNNRIYMMDSGSGGTVLGSNLTSFGSSGSGSGQFSFPEDVFVDTAINKIYVTDSNNHRIDVMDSGSGGTTLGNNFTSFGSYGSGIGQFSLPNSIFIDTISSKAYVCEGANNLRVDVMDSFQLDAIPPVAPTSLTVN